MDAIMPRRPLPTPKPLRLEKLVKPPTASEERAPNILTRSPDKIFQNHFQAETFATADVRTIPEAVLQKNTDATANDYF